MNNISINNLFRRKTWISFAKIFTVPVLFLIAVKLIGVMRDVSFDKFSRDPLQTLEGKFYIGAISQIGILFWCVSAAILLYSLKIAYEQKKPKQQLWFLLFAGLLTVMMMIDDMFMFHDVIMPIYFHISEKVFYLFYGTAVVSLFYFFRKIVLKTDYLLFILAVILLGSSVITDIVIELGLKLPDEFFMEDGIKFLGLVSWFVYFIRTSYRIIES